MKLEIVDKNIKSLAFGMLFGGIGALLYIIGFIGLILEAYVLFGIMSFLTAICGIAALVFKIIFVWNVLRDKK